MIENLEPDPLLEQRVLAILESTGALKSGHFILSSGLHSDQYCQCAALFEHPGYGAEVADLFAAQLPRELHPEIVLAPALGGILWGYELARVFGVRSVFAERDPATKRFVLRRGFVIPEGARVLLAEDVITTGGSVLELLPIVTAAKALPIAIGAVVDRSKGGFQHAEARRGIPFLALCRLNFMTYSPDALPEHLAGIPATKPGSKPGADR